MEAGRFPTRAVKRVNCCQQPLNRYYWWVNGMNLFFSTEARADTRNISFKNSLRWSIYIIKSVYEIQLSCYDPPPLDATQQFPSGWTFILFSEVNMTFGLSNSVIRCFGELVLIYTFIITNHSLSTTLKGGGGGESGQGFMSCHYKIRLLPQRLFGDPMIPLPHWQSIFYSSPPFILW